MSDSTNIELEKCPYQREIYRSGFTLIVKDEVLNTIRFYKSDKSFIEKELDSFLRFLQTLTIKGSKGWPPHPRFPEGYFWIADGDGSSKRLISEINS